MSCVRRSHGCLSAGRITSEEGPHKAKLWSAATSGPPPKPYEFGPDGPDGTLNKNGGETDKRDRPYQPVQTLTKETPGPDGPDDGHGSAGEPTSGPPHDLSGEQRQSLAGAKTTTPPTPRGGAGELAKDHEAIAELAKHVGCLRVQGHGARRAGQPVWSGLVSGPARREAETGRSAYDAHVRHQEMGRRDGDLG